MTPRYQRLAEPDGVATVPSPGGVATAPSPRRSATTLFLPLRVARGVIVLAGASPLVEPVLRELARQLADGPRETESIISSSATAAR